MASVTVVVVPRERFSAARRALETLFRHTAQPFSLVYVDAGLPRPLRRHVEAEAQRKGFTIVRAEGPIPSNRARNLGLAQAAGDHVVLLDNDVLVGPGWLEALLACAEETGASAVAPLYLQGEPARGLIHMAGGTLRTAQADGRRVLVERDRFPGQRLSEVTDSLERSPTEMVEFHCLLVQRGAFDRIGPLDEALRATRDHEDFCLSVRQAGGTIYVEPSALVSYLPPPPVLPSDLPLYRLRWSRAWIESTLQHFHRKWKLDMDARDPHYRWLWRRRRLALRQLRVPHRIVREAVLDRRRFPGDWSILRAVKKVPRATAIPRTGA